MSNTPRTDAIAHRGFHADVLIAKAIDLCRELERENATLRQSLLIEEDRSLYWRAAEEKLKRENAALRAEVDQWASRCAAAIWMLPETVTGGELRAAQDKFHRERENLRREKAALRQAAVEVCAVGRVWITVWGDQLSGDSVRRFAELEKQILKEAR